MFEIEFYEKANGETPVLDYIRAIKRKRGKESRVKRNKIAQYIKVLEEKGTRAGEPYVKHIVDNIWELRPLHDRIFFAVLIGGKLVLLHTYVKKTMQTPEREIEKAKRELQDYLDRGDI